MASLVGDILALESFSFCFSLSSSSRLGVIFSPVGCGALFAVFVKDFGVSFLRRPSVVIVFALRLAD